MTSTSRQRQKSAGRIESTAEPRRKGSAAREKVFSFLDRKVEGRAKKLSVEGRSAELIAESTEEKSNVDHERKMIRKSGKLHAGHKLLDFRNSAKESIDEAVNADGAAPEASKPPPDTPQVSEVDAGARDRLTHREAFGYRPRSERRKRAATRKSVVRKIDFICPRFHYIPVEGPTPPQPIEAGNHRRESREAYRQQMLAEKKSRTHANIMREFDEEARDQSDPAHDTQGGNDRLGEDVLEFVQGKHGSKSR